ncbi:Kae1-associated serine/threonine protein kinase [Candidatus Woesearchaeota archaeon]|nr:Kae1-associated serine/threonine protein kinase [Candidatus Woesearchaeota archaeon]
MIIGHGAEAKLYKQGEVVVKERPQKNYRLKEIDEKLRKTRTRKEAKIIETMQKIGIPAPKLLNTCDKTMKIDMSYIDGQKVRDVMNVQLAKEIGRKIGTMHKNHIIHSDLTTSNMILKDEIHFIDFGLSYVSQKTEDKAVDLHLLERALESKHHEISKECVQQVIEGYKETNPEAEQVLKRLETVQKRGRNKK